MPGTAIENVNSTAGASGWPELAPAIALSSASPVACRQTCTTLVPASSGVNTKPSPVVPGAIGRKRKAKRRNSSSIRRLARQAVTSLNGSTNNSGRKIQKPITPKAESRLTIEKWLAAAASSGV
jgi:hypothetical protein